MDNIFTYVPYKETGCFSKLVTDYIGNATDIQPFYSLAPTADGLTKALTERAKYPIDRQALVTTLNQQYEALSKYPKTEENIQLLGLDNTFTVCTAHQPNLLTGYLYFVYKILHAIKLADELKLLHPDKNFVPVYYMGSEDNDLDELGTFRLRGAKFAWDGNGQKGAVGRMDTASLKQLLNDAFKLFGPPGNNNEELKDMLTKAYLQHKTVGKATQYLVNELFGKYGLVVLDPDEALLKASFAKVMEDELLHQASSTIITKQIELLGAHYKIQAHPREINLFYLHDQLRERIEKKGDLWEVVNTEIKFTQTEILEELARHPERFSPNVMLRGLYQETILPNIAFIGGGAEVAYWLQLKTLFAHYNVFYPSIHLRQSVQWVNANQERLIKQLGLGVVEIFKPEQQLIRELVAKQAGDEWRTEHEAAAIAEIFKSLKVKATLLDVTLENAAEAVLTKMKRQLAELEKKMLRAEKRKMGVQIAQIERLKKAAFPNGSLQERIDNFAEYYMDHGPYFFETIIKGIAPFRHEFLIIEPHDP